MLQLP
jgi:hypothetical protein